MNLDELDYPVPDPTWDYATPTLPLRYHLPPESDRSL
jgi:hypothetical protein